MTDHAVADAVGAQRGLAVAQAHEQVEPRGVDGLTHVGGRRVRVGVRVGVHDADDVEAERAEGLIGGEEPVGADGVRLRGRIGVAGGHEGRDQIGAEGAAQQSARLVRQPHDGVADHLQVGRSGDAQHGVTVVAGWWGSTDR